jgi:integrase
MSRAFRFPPYPKKMHDGSGQGRIKINGQHVYLGPWSDQARCMARYAELAQQHAAGQPVKKANGKTTVAEVIIAFLTDAKETMPTKEYWHFQRVAKVMVRLFKTTLASAFDTNSLLLIREALKKATWLKPEERAHHKVGPWSRSQINKTVTRIRRIWAWAEQRKMVPAGSWGHLMTLKAIPSTDRSVRQTKPRQGVDWPVVAAVLPHLPGSVAALAEVQYWTGMRPCEVCRMTPGDVEQVNGVWMFWLVSKNAWRPGREREAVILGPEAMRVLAPWLQAARSKGPDAPVFPSSKTSKAYTTGGYAQAFARVFKAHPELQRFCAYSLRHGAKRRIKRALGLDAARAVLRQTSIQTTDNYDAERDMTLAIEAARKTG